MGGLDDPIPLLSSLREAATERKLRLWSCACCRRLWGRPPRGDRGRGEAARRAVEAAEGYADGALGAAALLSAREGVLRECGDLAVPAGAPASAASFAAGGTPGCYWWCCLLAVKHAAECAADVAGEARAQADLLRDVFGPPPFRGGRRPARPVPPAVGGLPEEASSGAGAPHPRGRRAGPASRSVRSSVVLRAKGVRGGPGWRGPPPRPRRAFSPPWGPLRPPVTPGG